MGDGAIGAHLCDEHAAILPLGQEVARRAAQALKTGFPGAEWGEFRTISGELVERMFAISRKRKWHFCPCWTIFWTVKPTWNWQPPMRPTTKNDEGPG